MTELGLIAALRWAKTNLDERRAEVLELQRRAKAVMFDRFDDVFGDGNAEKSTPFFKHLSTSMEMALRWGGDTAPSGEVPVRFSPRIDPGRHPGSDANDWRVRYLLDIPTEKLTLRLSFDRWARRLMVEDRGTIELRGMIDAPHDGSSETESRRFAASMAACFGTIQETASCGWSPSETQKRQMLEAIASRLAHAFGAPMEGAIAKLQEKEGLQLELEMAVPGVKAIMGAEDTVKAS